MVQVDISDMIHFSLEYLMDFILLMLPEWQMRRNVLRYGSGLPMCPGLLEDLDGPPRGCSAVLGAVSFLTNPKIQRLIKQLKTSRTLLLE